MYNKRRYFKKEVYVVYKIVKKQTLNQAVELMEIHAPYVARKCELTVHHYPSR